MCGARRLGGRGACRGRSTDRVPLSGSPAKCWPLQTDARSLAANASRRFHRQQRMGLWEQLPNVGHQLRAEGAGQ
jgi:hypothetical protein